MNRTQTCPQFYNNISKKYANDLSIMAIGPLTNLALVYHYDNKFAQRINCLSIMGCQYSGMGMWQYFTADFNFNLDAHAAHIVMKVFNNIVILSLQYAFAYQTERIKDIFVNKQTLKSQLVADIYAPIMKMYPTACLCDPQTAFPLFCPSQMKAKCMMLSGVVQTMGKRTRGFFALRNPFDSSEKKVIFITQINKTFLQQEVYQSYY